MGKLIAHIKVNNLQDGLELDLWNEPDAIQFWGTNYDQYLATWTRMFQRFKSVNQENTKMEPWANSHIGTSFLVFLS